MELKKIENQVQLWERAAIIVPITVTAILAVFWGAGLFSFEILFYIACGMYFGTAVVWWWWTMYTMRFVIRILQQTNTGLANVSSELRNIRKDISVDKV